MHLKEAIQMTLQLELSPAEEREVQTNAEREGITVEEYARRRLLSPLSLQPNWRAMLRDGQAAARQAFAASGQTDEELSAEIEAEVKAYRAAQRRTVSPVQPE